MNNEENRLRTFSEWPGNAAVDSGRIARAGFYYTGRSLEVQCFLCGGIISEWNYGDQVMARHRQLSPNCPFVLSPSSTCNVPLVSSQSQNSPSSSYPRRSTSVRQQEPKPEYRTEAQRLRSFANWPVATIVSPESLAKAGFYYLQKADMVNYKKIAEAIFLFNILIFSQTLYSSMFLFFLRSNAHSVEA